MHMTKPDWDRYDQAFRSIEGLADVVRRLTQEVEVLKTILRDKGVWDELAYKNAMLRRLIADHSTPGFASDYHHTFYPYTLEEASFVQYRFKTSDQETAEFRRKVEEASSLT